MKNVFRFALAVLIAVSLLPIIHVMADDTRFEYSGTAHDSTQSWGSPYYYWQTFQPLTAHAITQARVVFGNTAPYTGSMQIQLKAAGGDGKPTGSALASTETKSNSEVNDGTFTNFTFTTPYYLATDQQYGLLITLSGTDSDIAAWANNDGGYARGTGWRSANGVDWTAIGFDIIFEEWGDTDPIVTTGAASAITTTTATLNGTLASLGGESSVNVYFGWRTATGGIYDYYTQSQVLSAPGTFSADLTNLQPGSTYYYAAFVSNATSTWYGDETSFTTGNALAVSTLDPSYITSATAQLNGNLTAMGDYTLVNLGFQYGNSTDYGTNATVIPRVAEGTFNAGITGLAGDTEYHYRAYGYSTNPWTNTTDYAFGVDKVFRTTAGSPANPLTVVTEVATDVTDTNATLNGNLTAIGNYIPVVGFRYGEFNGYWTQYSVGTQSATGTYNYTLTGLRAGTTYYFQAYATDANGPVEGAVLAFTTTGTYSSETTLRVTTNMAYQIGDTQARLTGSLNSLGLNSEAWVGFDYGPSTGFGSVTPSVRKTNKGGFDYVISGLTKGRTYYYRAGAIGATGEVAWGETLSFVAGEPVYVPGSPTPTTTPPPSSGTPTPIGPITLPGSWNTTLGRYILLVVLLISAPLLLMYILGGKMGKGLSGIVDSVIFTAWVIQGWVDLWILVTVLIVAGFIVWKSIFSPRGA